MPEPRGKNGKHMLENDIIVMDNMHSHHAKAAKEILDASGIKYHCLPPYTPTLNPFEKTFSTILSVPRIVLFGMISCV